MDCTIDRGVSDCLLGYFFADYSAIPLPPLAQELPRSTLPNYLPRVLVPQVALLHANHQPSLAELAHPQAITRETATLHQIARQESTLVRRPARCPICTTLSDFAP